MSTRRGSILLLCLAIVATITVLGAAFVRVAELGHGTNMSVHRRLLAHEAARAGLDHAIEQILRDHVNEPFTRMDAGARAAFTSLSRPYDTNFYNTDAALPGGFVTTGHDDVPVEHYQWRPVEQRWETGSFADGGASYAGRGRYDEPEFYNLAAPTFDPARTNATDPVRFSRIWDSSDPLPDRSQGLFYDERLRPIDGDPRQARALARYRLRYAVGVMDLDGAIVVNGDPAIDYRRFDTADPRGVADGALARMIRAQHRLPAIVDASSLWGPVTAGGGAPGSDEDYMTAGISGGARAAHVFTGRGWTCNLEQTTPGGPPVTFPLMFRKNGSFPRFCEGNDLAAIFVDSTSGVTGDPAGGEVIDRYKLLVARLGLGPQFSFHDWEQAVGGGKRYDSTLCSGDDGEVSLGGRFTPFGRGSTQGARGRFSGPVDTPWCVNLMTAPTRTIAGMVYGAFPPGAIQAEYRYLNDRLNPTINIRKGWGMVRGERDLCVDALSPAFVDYPAPSHQDITPNYHAPAFKSGDPGWRDPAKRYPGPMAVGGYDAGGVLRHDTLGRSLRSGADGEGLGAPDKVIDPYSGSGFVRRAFYWKDYRNNRNRYFAAVHGLGEVEDENPAKGEADGNKLIIAPRPDSLWADVAEAMAATIAVARGQYQQLSPRTNSHHYATDPAIYFDGGPWSGPRVSNIRDIDALFVANLGHDPAAPNDPTPQPIWVGKDVAFNQQPQMVQVTPTHNLASLALPTTLDPTGTFPLYAENHPADPAYDGSRDTYSEIERSQLAELIINDIRLSFFGANPDYPDFRPIDFNNDGTAACSGYLPVVVTGRETDLRINKHAPDADGDGYAESAVTHPFSHTGCFFVGRSRFWRVLVRGQVWDNVRRMAVSTAHLDTVLVIDPMNRSGEWTGAAADPAKGLGEAHVISQGWHFDSYRGLASRQY